MAAKNMEEIAVLMKKMRFRKKLFGGVNEDDVWRQLDQLQKEYRAAFDAQQERNNAWIMERNAEISRLKKQLSALGYSPVSPGSHGAGETTAAGYGLGSTGSRRAGETSPPGYGLGSTGSRKTGETPAAGYVRGGINGQRQR